jgi:uncharacterized repeat protein (TIGR04076 family)
MEYKILVKVKEIRGHCEASKVGDILEIEPGPKMTGKICPTAFNAIYPFIFAMRFDGQIPWAEDNKNKVTAVCPDPSGLVVYEISRARTDNTSKK